MSEISIQTLIIDDETPARNLIGEMLEGFSEFQIVGECSNGREAVEQILKIKPELVFLDVQMPLLNGFEVLEKIKDVYLPEIIFVTAYDKYALKAFDFHAVDYLLKPFSHSRFRQAVTVAKEKISGKKTSEEREIFSSLIENHRNQTGKLQRIFVRDNGKIILIEPAKINFIEAEDKYLRIYTNEKNYLLRQTLNNLETELDSQIFLRIHRSTIVNLTKVKEIHPLFNGEYLLILDTGAKLTLSRTYKNRFFEAFGKNS